jgi:hypothetical protein
LIELAVSITTNNDPQTAIRWLATARRLRERLGTPVWPDEQPRIEQLRSFASAALGTPAFEIAWSEGTRLAWDQAADEAATVLGSGRGFDSAAAIPGQPNPLP